MYVIGLTGNIATGKTTVAQMLAELGAHVIDADKLGHAAMRPGTRSYQAIVTRFGRDILDADGTIDRSALGSIVFADPDALADLEALVHPAVEEIVLIELQRSPAPICVVEAIKLLEAHLDRHCDAIWVTTSPRQTQIDRLVRSRGLTREQAILRIDAQPSPERTIARADVVIDNSGPLEHMHTQVLRAWQETTTTNSDRPNLLTLLIQWMVLTAGMIATLPFASRLVGYTDWRSWGPLALVCPLLAAFALWLIHRP